MGAYYRRVLDHALGALLRVEFTTQGSDVIERAADEGLPVVLVSADGSTWVLKPELATH